MDKLSAVLIVALALSLNGACADDEPETRIVGGFDASIEMTMHQASIRLISYDGNFGSGHICGGSLINNRTILTAAHCLVDNGVKFKPSELRIVGGVLRKSNNNGSAFVTTASRTVVHSLYNEDTLAYDIGVIILKDVVPSNHATFRPIARATTAPITNSTCIISGWGVLSYGTSYSPDPLQAANVLIYNRPLCSQSYLQLTGQPLNTGTVCAGVYEGGIDSCQGDSGGPLVCNNRLAGVVSSGYRCAALNYPGIYTDVQYYEQWIAENSSPALKISVLLLAALALLHSIV